jgi:hypothetical protein
MFFKKIYMFFILLILVLFFSLNIFANNNFYNNLLDFRQITNSDTINNTFYLSKNSNLILDFEMEINYDKLSYKNNNDPRIEITYESFGTKNKNLNLDLSNNLLYFQNSFLGNFSLHVSTNSDFQGNTISKVQIDLYDEYNNLLDTKRIYLNFVYNNSQIYDPITKNHSKPRFLGYNYSRDFAILQSNNDSDIINVNLKSDYDNYNFVLNCKSDENINLNIIIKDKSYKNFDLLISVDSNKTLSKEFYYIYCYAQDNYETNKLKDIIVKYKPIEENTDFNFSENLNLESSDNKYNNFSKLSAFFNLNKSDFNFKYTLLFILIILILLMFIKTKKII